MHKARRRRAASTSRHAYDRHTTLLLLTTPQDAHEAFQMVAMVAKVLQDSGLRAGVDAVREDADLRKQAAAAAAAIERDRQWQAARGQAPMEGVCARVFVCLQARVV
jgi:hypothetical protein